MIIIGFILNSCGNGSSTTTSTTTSTSNGGDSTTSPLTTTSDILPPITTCTNCVTGDGSINNPFITLPESNAVITFTYTNAENLITAESGGAYITDTTIESNNNFTLQNECSPTTKIGPYYTCKISFTLTNQDESAYEIMEPTLQYIDYDGVNYGTVTNLSNTNPQKIYVTSDKNALSDYSNITPTIIAKPDVNGNSGAPSQPFSINLGAINGPITFTLQYTNQSTVPVTINNITNNSTDYDMTTSNCESLLDSSAYCDITFTAKSTLDIGEHDLVLPTIDFVETFNDTTKNNRTVQFKWNNQDRIYINFIKRANLQITSVVGTGFIESGIDSYNEMIWFKGVEDFNTNPQLIITYQNKSNNATVQFIKDTLNPSLVNLYTRIVNNNDCIGKTLEINQICTLRTCLRSFKL